MIRVLYSLARAVSFAVSFSAGVVVAQNPTAKPLSYDVVTIRPNHTGSGSTRVNTDADHFEMTNVTLAFLLQRAFDLRPAQLVNLPPWASSEHFDLQGKILDADPATLKKMKPEDRRPMFQALIKEHFGLKFHREQRSMPVYELVVAKGRPGMEALPPPKNDAEGEADSQAPRAPGGMSRGSIRISDNAEGAYITAVGITMASLARVLSNSLNRAVIDKTGLTAEYSFQLRWAPEDGAPADSAPPVEALPSIFTAVQEQLGLRLVANKGDVEVFVIDHVDHPSEN